MDSTQSNAGNLPTDDSAAEQQILALSDDVKEQLRVLFDRFDKSNDGRISTHDLYQMVDAFDDEQPTKLFNDDSTKQTFLSFCEQNPDMDVTMEDVFQLIDRLRIGAAATMPSVPSTPSTPITPFAQTLPAPSAISAATGSTAVAAMGPDAPLSARSRSSPVTKFGHIRGGWRHFAKQRLAEGTSSSEASLMDDEDYSTGEDSLSNRSRLRRISNSPFNDFPGRGRGYPRPYMQPSGDLTDGQFELGGNIDETVANFVAGQGESDPAQQLSRLYAHTVDLAKRLKESERHLASIARQHEDRIEELQTKLDETKTELQYKKREIQDHKSKEKTNLHQISALEAEIQRVGKNLNNQKQLYQSLKRQYEEQSEEAEKLRDLVRIKEEELTSSEKNLSSFTQEQKTWADERHRLEAALARLEQQIASSHEAERELDQQRSENVYLKETIDKLKVDLDDIRSGKAKGTNEFDVEEDPSLPNLNLKKELEAVARQTIAEESDDNADDQRSSRTSRRRREGGIDSSTTEVGDEPVQEKERSSRKGSGNRSLRRQAMDTNGARSDIEQSYQILSSELGQQYALIEGMVKAQHDKRDRRSVSSISGDDAALVDTTRHSRSLGRPTTRNRRKRTAMSTTDESEQANGQSPKALVARGNMTLAQNSTIVNNTVTFALYTLVVYLFGIITSVFVLDSNQGPVPYTDWIPMDVRDESWTMRSLEIILYWVETLLNDGNNMKVPT